MDSTVRLATDDDVLRILGSDGVINRIGCEPSPIVNGNGYVVNDRLLLLLIDHGESVEAHIAQPKRHWPSIHKDISQSLNFIVELGYNLVYTNVHESLKTTLNLLFKHGFQKVDSIDKEVILRWESQQV